MIKTFWIAWREFTHTVLTKGFLIGVGIFPLIMFGAILLVPKLINQKPPKVSGTVAVIDRTGDQVLPFITERITPEAIAKRFEQQMGAGLGIAAAVGGAEAAQRVKEMIGEAPELTVEPLAPDADPESAKAALREGGMSGGRLALVVVSPTAVARPDPAQPFGGYEIFVRPKLDDRIQDDIIEREVNRAIVDTRIKLAGYNPQDIRALTSTPAVKSTTVTETGEQTTNMAAQVLIPAGFMFLLWISAFTGGQYLLTTTIEEKSNRVMEVLLSAVSPMQLMVGKIIGQMCVGLLILVIYTSLGSGALITFGLAHLLSAANIAYLLIFFFLAFFVIASLMAAIGSAVTDIHEAQSLMGPVMLVFVIPMMLWFPLSRDPMSPLATGLSFVPAINPFVMVIRIASSPSPLPLWQIAGSIAVGVATMCFAAWAAAKIFRIGVLMYGKPPNLATLFKWVRMA